MASNLKSHLPLELPLYGTYINDLEESQSDFVGDESAWIDDEVHSITLRKAAFHVFKANVGAGIFLLPSFFQATGYFLGGVVMVILGLVVIDCTCAIVEVKQKLESGIFWTYPSITRHVLGSAAEKFVYLSLVLTQFGFCTIYLQYSASTLASLSSREEYEVWFLVLCTILVTPWTFQTHRMEILAYSSLVATISVFVALIVTSIAASSTLIQHGISDEAYVFVFSPKIILFASGYLFSLEGIGIVLPVENSLQPADQKEFPTLLKKILFLIIALYFVFGAAGYIAYGGNLTTSVVFSLPDGVRKLIIEFFLVLSLLLSFPVQYVPAIQIFDIALDINEHYNHRIALRVCINIGLATVAGICGSAALNLMASFIGAVGGVHLMITVPTLLMLFVDQSLQIECKRMTAKDNFLFFVCSLKDRKRLRYVVYLFLTLVTWVGAVLYTGLAIYRNPVAEELGPTTEEESLDTVTALS